jgi:imidazolonepropionase
MAPSGSLLLRRIGALVTGEPSLGEGPLGVLRDAAVLCRNGRIEWVGPDSDVPRSGGDEPLTIDIDGHLVTPGLIDCHTHLVFAGDRLDDFQARLSGETYGAISKRGGGILSTVRATRAASDDLLADLAEARVEKLVAHGVTTVEVKSGYGLSTQHEVRMLEAVRRTNGRVVAELVPTFLGAHTLPVEARRSDAARAAYLDEVVQVMLPRVAERKLARFCDVFIEDGAFTVAEGRRILQAAKTLGLGVKIHAEQMSQTGAAGLAAELGAASAEHLEHASDDDLRAMAKAGVVAVLLPGASLFLRDQPADARRFLDAGLKVAVATDYNPGSSPTPNLLLMAQMAVLESGLPLEHALLAITTHAARALALHEDRGALRPGMRADLALFRCLDWRELFYEFGTSPCTGVVKDGRYYRVDALHVQRLRGR